MNNENERVKQITDGFEQAVEAARKLRGGIKSFVIIAEAAECEPDSTGRGGLDAVGGTLGDIVNLAMSFGLKIVGKILQG